MKKPKIFIDCSSLKRGGGVSHYIEEFIEHIPDNVSVSLFVTEYIETEYNTVKLYMYNTFTRLIYEHIIMPIISFILGGDILFLPKSYAPVLQLLPAVTTMHDIIPQQDRGETFVTRLYWKIQNASAAYFAKAIVFINEEVHRQFMDRYTFCKSRYSVIHNGYDTYPVYDKQGNNYILIPGAVKARKQTMKACAIAHRIYMNRPDKQIILTGRIEDRGIMRNIQEQFPEIVLAGYVDNESMADYMNNAYVVIYMSQNEGFSLPIAESCYLNKPVICSDIPLHRHIYSDYPIYYNDDYGLDIKRIISALENHEEKTCKKQYWSETVSSTITFINSIGK